jgi:hypothetical protein
MCFILTTSFIGLRCICSETIGCFGVHPHISKLGSSDQTRLRPARLHSLHALVAGRPTRRS